MKHIVVVGGGAGGFFAAINCKEKNPDYRVTILEKGRKVLEKVKISGGGRCNVTHACFEARELAQNYPRGQKELLGAFSRFQAGDTVAWFEERGVALKIEEDGRMFPTTDSSQTIIDCFLTQVKRLGISLRTGTGLTGLAPPAGGKKKWLLRLKSGENITADRVLLATGSSRQVWKMLEKQGYRIEEPIPSLFTFNIKDPRLEGLAGVSLPQAEAQVPGTNLQESGALLVTHWGLSAPAILRLSAWGAKALYERKYQFKVRLNFIPGASTEDVQQHLMQLKAERHRKQVSSQTFGGIPTRLWKKLVAFAGIGAQQRWAETSKKQLLRLAEALTQSEFAVSGKSTFKEEFVTCGGLHLDELDFRSMESKRHKGLFFSGEMLNIDAITGGFNFQNAWTTAWIAAQHM